MHSSREAQTTQSTNMQSHKDKHSWKYSSSSIWTLTQRIGQSSFLELRMPVRWGVTPPIRLVWKVQEEMGKFFVCVPMSASYQVLEAREMVAFFSFAYLELRPNLLTAQDSFLNHTIKHPLTWSKFWEPVWLYEHTASKLIHLWPLSPHGEDPCTMCDFLYYKKKALKAYMHNRFSVSQTTTPQAIRKYKQETNMTISFCTLTCSWPDRFRASHNIMPFEIIGLIPSWQL